ncbi:MAG: hypothetical protein ACR2KB_13645 [Chitinophagaceae bacterium]
MFLKKGGRVKTHLRKRMLAYEKVLNLLLKADMADTTLIGYIKIVEQEGYTGSFISTVFTRELFQLFKELFFKEPGLLYLIL